jgi:Coatomer WD associated region
MSYLLEQLTVHAERVQTAQKLDDKGIIHRLGLEAFRHGNLEIVEWCFQQTKAYERLSFLYTVNGNTDKLSKMLKIAEMRGNVMSRYHNALYAGSARARVAILKYAGHTALAYVCAKTHGLEHEAAALAELLGDKLPEVRLALRVLLDVVIEWCCTNVAAQQGTGLVRTTCSVNGCLELLGRAAVCARLRIPVCCRCGATRPR